MFKIVADSIPNLFFHFSENTAWQVFYIGPAGILHEIHITYQTLVSLNKQQQQKPNKKKTCFILLSATILNGALVLSMLDKFFSRRHAEIFL